MVMPLTYDIPTLMHPILKVYIARLVTNTDIVRSFVWKNLTLSEQYFVKKTAE